MKQFVFKALKLLIFQYQFWKVLRGAITLPSASRSYGLASKITKKKTISLWVCEIKSVNNIYLRIHWRLSTVLKTIKKIVWSNVFWYVKVCIFWKYVYSESVYILKLYSIRYTLRQNANVKTISFEQNERSKNVQFFFTSSNTWHLYF